MLPCDEDLARFFGLDGVKPLKDSISGDERLSREISRQIFYKIFENGNVILLDNVETYFLGACSNADFASDYETVYVSGIFSRRIKDFRKLVYLIDLDLNSKADKRFFAEDCLFSLTLFRDHFEYRYKHRAAPKPEFYEKVGSQIFRDLNEEDLSKNFSNWTSFLSEFIN